MSLTLSIAHTQKTLEEWGIAEATLTEQSRRSSQLDLTTPALDATVMIMTKGDRIDLYQDGELAWSGECVSSGSGFTGNSEVTRFRCMGLWHFLDRQIYRQKRLDPSANPITPIEPVEWSPNVVLFHDDAAERATTKAQLADIVDQSTRITLGDISTMQSLNPLGEEGKSLTIVEAIQRCLNWHPKAITRLNADGSLDVLEEFEAYNLPLAEYADSLSVNPRPDLQLRGVELIYRNAYQAAPSDPQTVVDTAGETAGENIARLEYDLGGVSLPPEGVAAHWLSQFSALQHEVSVTIVGEPQPGTWMGRAVSISGSPWSDINVPIQRVVYDLTGFTTSISAAPLPTYAIDDLIELLRLRQYSTSQDGARIGTQPFSPETPGTPFSSYRVAEDTFRLSPGYVGGVSLSNPDDDYEGDGLIWLEVAVDENGGATSVASASGSTVPTAEPTLAIIPLHSFTTSAGVISVIDGRTGNMPFLSIGTANGHYWE